MSGVVGCQSSGSGQIVEVQLSLELISKHGKLVIGLVPRPEDKAVGGGSPLPGASPPVPTASGWEALRMRSNSERSMRCSNLSYSTGMIRPIIGSFYDSIPLLSWHDDRADLVKSAQFYWKTPRAEADHCELSFHIVNRTRQGTGRCFHSCPRYAFLFEAPFQEHFLASPSAKKNNPCKTPLDSLRA